MQRVDPFIPITPRRMTPVSSKKVPQLVKYSPHVAAKAERPRPIQPPLPCAATPVTPVAPMSKARQAQVPPKLSKKKSHPHMAGKLKSIGLVLAILMAGAAAGVLVVGEMIIAVYAVYAFVRRLKSRTTFMLVLVSLMTIMLLHATGKDAALASNFAVYSLLLAFIGIVSLAREVRVSTR